MTVIDKIKPGRQKRSPNGVQRDSKVWSIRDVKDSTKLKGQVLSTLLDAPLGRVIDEAIKRLMMDFTEEAAESDNKCMTLSDNYSWLLNIDLPPSNDPRVKELESRLAQKRRARDVIMGRKP